MSWGVITNLTGPAGATGSAGAAGTDGLSVLNGSGIPSSGLGSNGDFYIDTAVYNLYGPKASGSWGTGVSLVGPTRGSALMSGDGPPAAGVAGATHASSGDAYVESLDINVPAGTADGEVLLLAQCNDGLENLATPDGWTLLNQSPTGGDGITSEGLWWREADSEPTLYTIVMPEACIVNLVMVRCSGVVASAVRAHSTAVQPDDVTPSPAPAALSGVQASDLVVACYGYGDRSGHSDAGATITGPGGLWVDEAFSATAHLDDYNSSLLVVSGPGSATLAAATPSRTGSWVIQAVALEAAQVDVGADGDFYLDTANSVLYGPKTSGAWGAGIPLGGGSGGIPGNVQDFGATGDGVTDDTAAIQAAINAHGAIWLPGGTYLVSSTLSCPDTWSQKFAIVGESLGQTIINYTGSGPCIQLDPTESPSSDSRRNFWQLKNLTINGPGSGVADTIGVHLNNAIAGSITDVQVAAFDVGVKFDGLGLVDDTACYYNAATNLSVNGCGTVAVWFSGQANSNTMLGGQANSSATGVLIDPTTNNVNLHGTAIESNTTYGVDVAGSGNHFLGCRFENPDTTAEVRFNDSAGGDNGTQNVVISYFSSPGDFATDIIWSATQSANTVWVPGFTQWTFDDLPPIHASDVDAQPVDSDLTAIAGLSPANNDFMQRKSGAWANRTVAQVKTDLAINLVSNTADASKPVSTAQQAALDLKQDLSAKGAASGYASLDGTTKVPIAQLPTGTTSGTVAIGNDSRLSDSRTPTGTAGGVLTGTYPNPGLKLVPSTPYTVTYAATVSLDPTAGNNPNLTLSSGNVSVSVSTTGALDGQMVMLSVLASGASRTVTATNTLTAGLTSPFTVASGKVGYFGFRYSSLLSAWTLIAQTNTV